MSIPPMEWGLWGGHTGSQNEGFVSPPAAGWGGQWEAKWGVPPDVVEFEVKGECGVIKWGIPHSRTAGTQNGVALTTVGVHRGG